MYYLDYSNIQQLFSSGLDKLEKSYASAASSPKSPSWKGPKTEKPKKEQITDYFTPKNWQRAVGPKLQTFLRPNNKNLNKVFLAKNIKWISTQIAL